ncbi:hypothetical protein [Kouleothrix sp.]|uniref:hypothetical protein n=1 Tax=Kouleothrix sp. TaxID=2779161 RepID=UPI00391DB1F1
MHHHLGEAVEDGQAEWVSTQHLANRSPEHVFQTGGGGSVKPLMQGFGRDGYAQGGTRLRQGAQARLRVGTEAKHERLHEHTAGQFGVRALNKAGLAAGTVASSVNTAASVAASCSIVVIRAAPVGVWLWFGDNNHTTRAVLVYYA